MQYEILAHTNRNQLEVIVRNYLNDGWRLQGGVGVAVMNDNNDGYVQAVVKD